ncbi:MAG: ABC transporter [Acidobacteria bacterium]|nr:ABC transporter [Acidobacteriota bacterium]|tara:strand:+ start:774 stop:1541 length:768 start_codon:yes stop_codon:yes gene_type:complete
MGNILALVQKEVRGYFVSPIAYVLLVFFTLLFGWFYIASLNLMLQLSGGNFGMGGPQVVNVNEFMIRPLFGNTAVILLFLLPMLTMRSYAEEKRSGTIELLLTSPLSDFQIIMGKFLGALALYTLMLALTGIHIAMLFQYGEPEWGPILTGYLGLILMGSSFISIGLAISSMTKNQIVAGVATFAVLLLFWIINWIGDASGSTAQSVLAYLSILEHFDDFSKGVIDTKHLTYYLSFIGLGLFLTAKSMDTARWNG